MSPAQIIGDAQCWSNTKGSKREFLELAPKCQKQVEAHGNAPFRCNTRNGLLPMDIAHVDDCEVPLRVTFQPVISGGIRCGS